jgi:hypothetical protein
MLVADERRDALGLKDTLEISNAREILFPEEFFHCENRGCNP